MSVNYSVSGILVYRWKQINNKLPYEYFLISGNVAEM